jgi:ribulose-5-phosphate 4-epimerase/fuculose-1-phosphate aldolase
MSKPARKLLQKTAPKLVKRPAAKGKKDDPAVRQARIDLAAAYRLANRFGLSEGIDNHFTLAVPGRDDRFLLLGFGVHFSEVTAGNLIEVDLQGKVTKGEFEAEATAFFIHARMHKALPHAKCILHTHMPYATAITTLEGGRLEMCTQNALRFESLIAYDDDYRGLALDNDEGDRLARAMGDKKIMFLANHGVIVAAPTVAQAFDHLYFVERACMVQVMAQWTGGRLKRVRPEVAAEARRLIERDSPVYAGHHFAALKRMLDREQPEYKR